MARFYQVLQTPFGWLLLALGFCLLALTAALLMAWPPSIQAPVMALCPVAGGMLIR